MGKELIYQGYMYKIYYFREVLNIEVNYIMKFKPNKNFNHSFYLNKNVCWPKFENAGSHIADRILAY